MLQNNNYQNITLKTEKKQNNLNNNNNLNNKQKQSKQNQKQHHNKQINSYSELHKLHFIYDFDKLIFPIECLYKDTQLLLPYYSLDLDNYYITKDGFDILSKNFAHCRHLLLNYSVGITLQRLDSIKHFGMLSILHLRGTITISVDVALIIAGYSRLTELDISENIIEPKALMTMLPRLTILKTLYCIKCQNLDDFSMQAIALCVQQHRKLSNINLSNVSSFSDEGALALFNIGMNILHDIDISGCTSLTSLAIASFRKKMSTLRKLNLSSIRYIGQSAFEWISEGCIFVTNLDLSKNSTLDDAGIILIGKRCHHLKILNLSNCINISDDGITGFINNFQEGNGILTSLDISGCVKCSAATGYSLTKIGNNLKQLKLNCLSQITSNSMKSLWESLIEIEVFEMSADLRSSGTHRRSIIPHISDQIIINGLMTTIKVINMVGACLVSDIGICWIVRNCLLLEEIDVSYCNSITNQFLIDLGTYSKNLKSINISGLGHITDIGFISLINGCNELNKINCTACNKITDIGIESLKQLKKLESLNISSCDTLTDDGILSFCTSIHTLKYVNISHLDLLTSYSIHQLIKNNKLLIQLNCIGCNILQIDYNNITHYLPYGMAMTSKCKLEPRHRSIIRYNNYVMNYNKKIIIVIKIQSIIRCFINIRKYSRLLKKRSKSALTIQRIWRGYNSRKIISNKLQEIKIYHKNVINLQHKLKRLFAIYLTRKKKKYLLHRLKHTKILQRNIRGYLTRNRLYFRFRHHPKYHKRIFYLINKLILFRTIRKIKLQIILIQKNIRRKVQQIRYKKILIGIRKFILHLKLFYLTNKITKLLCNELLDEYSVKEYAIEKIIKWYRNIKYNIMLCDYVYECSIVYRNNEDMKEWEYEQQTINIIKIQTKYRSYNAKKKFNIMKRRQKEGNIAILVIQKNVRRFIQQMKYKRWRIKMKRVIINWKQMYHLILSFYYRKQVKIIQKLFKKYLFLQQRSKAATIINRVSRGHLARKRVRGIIHDIHSGLVLRIQRVWKKYKEKKYRHFIYAKRHIAAMRIQRAARRRLEHKAKQRVIAAKKARMLELELQRKEQLLRDKRMKVIERIKNTAINQFATRIQRQWRKHKIELDKKQAAKKAREDMMKELAIENQRKRDAVLRLPNPLNAARRMIHNFNRFVEQANKVDEKEKPKFTYSVLKYQTLSIKQVGIIDIAMTYGEGERYAFQSRQEFFKSTQKRYFEMLDGDLSGHLKLEIALWIMRGTGTECICELQVKKKPEKSSIAAIKNRVTAKRLDGINIAWHERVHLEIHGICSLKRNETGFAIDEIRICHDMESAQEAKDDGLFLVQDLLKYSFPTSLWAHGKEQPPDESIFPLVEIEGEVWFDDRMRQSCYKYNLTVEDIYQMRATWDGIQEGSFDFYCPTFAVWDYMNIPRIELCNWLIESIVPESILQLSFSEYVHLISFFSVFGLQEKIRFIFGYVCTKSHQTLDANQFEHIVEILTEGFTGQRNLLGWKKEFDRYCHPKLKVMFIKDFEKFVTEHIRIFWGLDEIQLKFRTYNLGRNYWEGKNEKFVEVRQKLGFVMTK